MCSREHQHCALPELSEQSCAWEGLVGVISSPYCPHIQHSVVILTKTTTHCPLPSAWNICWHAKQIRLHGGDSWTMNFHHHHTDHPVRVGHKGKAKQTLTIWSGSIKALRAVAIRSCRWCDNDIDSGCSPMRSIGLRRGRPTSAPATTTVSNASVGRSLYTVAMVGESGWAGDREIIIWLFYSIE